MSDETISTGRAAELAHVSKKTMRRWLMEDGPDHVPHREYTWADGRVRRIIDLAEFEAWLEAHRR